MSPWAIFSAPADSIRFFWVETSICWKRTTKKNSITPKYNFRRDWLRERTKPSSVAPIGPMQLFFLSFYQLLKTAVGSKIKKRTCKLRFCKVWLFLSEEASSTATMSPIWQSCKEMWDSVIRKSGKTNTQI